MDNVFLFVIIFINFSVFCLSDFVKLSPATGSPFLVIVDTPVGDSYTPGVGLRRDNVRLQNLQQYIFCWVIVYQLLFTQSI